MEGYGGKAFEEGFNLGCEGRVDIVNLGIEGLMTLGEGSVALGEAVDSFFELVGGGLAGMVIGHGVGGRSDQFDTNLSG